MCVRVSKLVAEFKYVMRSSSCASGLGITLHPGGVGTGLRLDINGSWKMNGSITHF